MATHFVPNHQGLRADAPVYESMEEIYRGSRYAVFRARRSSDGLLVVIKTVLAGRAETEAAGARLRAEHDLLVRLALPMLAQPLALLETAAGPALMLADAGSQNLKTWLRRRPLAVETFFAIAIQIADAVMHVHEHNVIHRDISPLNLIVDAEQRITLVDFDAATTLSAFAPGAGVPPQLESSLFYIAPEQTGRMNRLADHRADLYSLGAVLYELLTGAPPFSSADPVELVHAHLARAPIAPAQLIPGLPVVLSDVVLRLLAKTPEQRYQSAEALLADLREARHRLDGTGNVAAFDLGLVDLARELPLPESLYGRERELAELEAAFDRVAAGDRELVLVTGAAGVGKSAMVGQLRSRVTAKHGHFVVARSDLRARGMPYASLVDGFRSLIVSLLEEPDPELALWRQRLREALGPNGRVISELIPDLERLIGAQPPIATVESRQNENRFRLVFQAFLRALATRDRPLVVFADDLQWADLASLSLLRILAAADDASSFLLLVAFRPDEEPAPGGPLRRTLMALHDSGVATHQIELHGLELGPLIALLCDTLRCDQERGRQLAEVLLRKTDGNPFFIKRLLRHLHKSGLLAFDAEHGAWQWDLLRVDAVAVTENVADLLVTTLQGLPEATQRVLEIAACLGRQFSPQRLAHVDGQTPEVVAHGLAAAVREGLLVPLDPLECPRESGPWYQFAHDRVQQAADSLLDDNERQKIHRAIGRQLLAAAGTSSEAADQLFEVVDHLNLAGDLITDEHERLELAALNARAARLARASSATGQALDFLERAIRLLPDDAWQSHHELIFSLHHDAVECCHFSGNPERGEALFASALAHVESPIEKAALYDIRVVASTLEGDLPAAVRWGAAGLELMGVALPAPERANDAVTAEIAAVEGNLNGRAIAELVDAPEMRLPDQIMAMQLLSNLLAPTYMGRQDLYAFVVARMLNISLVHGNSVYSPFAYAGYGVILPWFTNDYARAHAFGTIGVALCRRVGDPFKMCRAIGLFGCFVNSWREPMRSSVSLLREAIAKGLESGEIQYANYWGLSVSKHLFYQGIELSRLLVEVENAMALGRQHNIRAGSDWQLSYRQAIRCLQGRTRASDSFDDAEFEERDYVASVAAEPYALSLYETVRLQVLYLVGSFTKARALAETSRERVVFQRSTSAVVDYNFYTSLTLAAGADDHTRVAAIEAIEANQRELAVWAENCPENYGHKQLIVAAELARLKGEDVAAAALYDQAVEAAERERFLQDEALANELAGRFYRGLGRSHIASFYLANALAGYARWGATLKVDMLEREFPTLALAEIRPSGEDKGVAALDLLGIFKAAEAISSEVVLDRLLATLMEVCLATAGAERGAIALAEEDGLVVRVFGSITETAVLDRTPVGRSDRVPAGIIECVRTSGEPLLLVDAARDGNFTTDPYVTRQAVRSVLAMPIRKQAKLTGVLYLENNLATRVFTPERLRVLQLLSSQIAVSLENSRLFEKVTAEVQERARAESGMRLLADAGVALAESLDAPTILDRVTRLTVPRLADWCLVDVVAGSDLPRVATRHADPAKQPLLDQLLEHPAHLASQCLRTGESVLLSEVTDATLKSLAGGAEHERLLRALGTRSAMTVALRLRGPAIGTLTLVSSTLDRRYGARELALAEELARRAAMAIENARLYRETQEAVRVRDEFLSVASHELNTPMTSLNLSLQNLLDQAAEGPIDHSLVVKTAALAERQGQRLTVLIRDLLDVTRLERGGLALNREPGDLSALVRDVVARFRPELDRVDCEIRVHAPAPVLGTWDATRLEQVVLNLLANAAKFGAGKPIEIGVERRGERARLWVRDYGIGIDPARQARIFDRFERAVSAKHYGGLGLGLYICRRIVDAHGGSISVDSQLGAGATFVVELPLRT